MSGSGVHACVAGSKMLACGDPMMPLRLSQPPTTMTRPSASVAWPEQKMLLVVKGVEVNALVAGSKTEAPRPPLPQPGYMSTLAVSRSTMLTATNPRLTGADHAPRLAGPVGL